MTSAETIIDGNTVPQLHKSFFEFITGECVDSCFRISKSSLATETMFTLASFQVMEVGLHFNICQLETSYFTNEMTPNLASHIMENIPKHLTYSCCFWSSHLQATEPKEHILTEIREFLYGRFLYWLEALSLLKKVDSASHMLSSLIEWIHVSLCLSGFEKTLIVSSLRLMMSRSLHLQKMLIGARLEVQKKLAQGDN